MERVILNEAEIAALAAQYDENAKRILSNRAILARILKGTAEEFKEIPSDVIANECNGDDILVSKVRLEPGETNTKLGRGEGQVQKKSGKPAQLTGDRTEDNVPGEGKVFFDIRFSAYVPGKDEIIKILMNVEAQKEFYVGYAFVTRGIFYGARMISAQRETEFKNSDYAGLKKVYSIWICMNSPNYIGNAISEYGITKRDIVPGIPDVAEDYDKLSVVVICLNRKTSDREVNELIGMLNTVFDKELSAAAKKQILNKEYGMTVEKDVEEVIGHMCNLGEGIYEDGLRDGEERGMERGIERGKLLQQIEIIHNNLLKNINVELLAELVGVDVEMVCKIAEMVAENADVTDEELVEWYYKNNVSEK